MENDEIKRNHIRYDGLDWLRVIACLGIVMMHMASRFNNDYMLSDSASFVIGSFTDFVFLFMATSAFGMCCGYFEKFIIGDVDLIGFYKKRYMKILPFFALVVLIDLVVEFSKDTVMEAIADVTLSFGLFPNDIKVIGVGWFLGLIFAFYMLFPFFCVLIDDKRAAWMTFAVSVLLNYVTGSYFGIGRKNIVYCFCFFVLGGLIYHYREQLSSLKLYISIPTAVICVALYYAAGGNVVSRLLVSGSLVMLAISDQCSGVFGNKVIRYLSGISLEIYLCHMVMFRGIEKLGLNYAFGNGMLQYILTVMMVLGCSIVFVVLVKKVGKGIERFCLERFVGEKRG